MRSVRSLLALLLAASALSPASARAWPHSPTQNVPIGTVAEYPTNPFAMADGSGGIFLVHSKSMPGTGNDIFVQHYDAGGNALWTAGGVLVCNAADQQYPEGICSDGSGGVIVVWSDYRAGYPNVDLYARRVTSAGTATWTANGVQLCNAPDRQVQSSVCSDNNGGAYVAWVDYRTDITTNADVYMQHLDAAGARTMGASGLAICALNNYQGEPKVAADQYYGYVVWSDSRAGLSDIYAQRVDAGSALWSANGVAVCNAPNSQYSPQMVAASLSSLIVGWSDARSGNDDIYAQRIDVWSGNGVWGTNGVLVCNATGFQILGSLVDDGTGNFVLAWVDGRAGATYAPYAQKIDFAGVPQWAANGMPVRSGSGTVSNVVMAADGAGGTLVGWQENRSDNGDVFVQRLNASGYPMWTATGVPVCVAAGAQQSPRMVASNGGAYFVWFDFRPAYQSGMYMQAVDRWGYLGAEPVMAGVGDVPNDQGGKVRVAWYGSPLDTDPLFNNVTSYVVFRSVTAPLAVALEKSAPLRGTAPFTALGGRTFRRFSSDATTEYFWEEVARVTPRHLGAYSAIVSTAGDSVAGSNPRTSFMVMAEANYGNAWWISASDSAYSVDNIAPAPPAPFTGQYAPAGTRLHWDPNTEPDLASYRIYRGNSPSFTPAPGNLVASVPDTGYVDHVGVTYFYKLTAVDSHGNESAATLLVPSGTTGAEAVAGELAFRAPSPNPASRATTLRFALPHAGTVRLAVYDAAGRLVRTLASGEQVAGEHAVAWDLRDDTGHAVGAGLYFARMDAEGRSFVRRVAVTR